MSKMNLFHSRRFQRAVLLCAVSVALNVTVSWLSSRLGLPLYLDSIGTIFAAAVGGYLPGAITGFLTNALKGFWDLQSVYYIPISVLLALVTAYCSHKNWLLRFPHLLLTLLGLALTGGGLGSVLTWFLYGCSFSGGPIGQFFLGIGLAPMLAQLLNDLLLDFADKALSLFPVLLALLTMPESLRSTLSVSSFPSVTNQPRGTSLRTKVMLVIFGAASSLAIIVTGLTLSFYNDSLMDEKSAMAYGVARMSSTLFDPDRVPEYLEKGHAAEGYSESENALADIVESADDIVYVYIYQIREDGCHVVFDPDTAAGPGDDPGAVIDFDEAFLPVLPELLAGEPIDPIISDESFGWLLSVYLPVRDSSGVCQCYVGVDISMELLRQTEYAFLARLTALFLGFSLLIMVLGFRLADESLVRPVNSLVAATTAFAARSAEEQEAHLGAIQALDISTGDEIENLYLAIRSTTEQVVCNIEELQKKNAEITKLQSGLIMVLADMVESRDKCTGNHVRNTASYAGIILEQMRRDGLYPDILTDDYIADVVSSAPLHDVGKIQVPDALLNKPGRLTDEEFALMKNHTLAGGEIIDRAIATVSSESSSYLTEARNLTLYHHERWDGKGYPTGIKGEEIPLSARVMAVADVFDALVSRRSYKNGFPIEKALSIIREESGTHFDPDVVKAFLEVEDEARAIATEANIRNAQDY